MSDTGWSTPNQLSGSGPAQPNQLSGPGAPAPTPDPGAANDPGTPGDPTAPPVPSGPIEPAAATDPAAGWLPPAAPPVAKKRPAWRSGLVQIAVIALIAVAALIFRDRLSGNASDLRVGDCFDEPSGTATEVKDVQHHPCTEPHDGEVYFVGNYPDSGTYPGRSAFETWAAGQCVPAWEVYVGRDYETDKEYDFSGFFPIQDGWNSGDHEISCYIIRVDHGKMNSSVKVGAG